MWVLSEEFKNMITHGLRVEDVTHVSIERAVIKHDYAHPKRQKCEYWACEQLLENTITYPLRAEDMGIEWAVRKHDYAHPKSVKTKTKTKSNMWALSIDSWVGD